MNKKNVKRNIDTFQQLENFFVFHSSSWYVWRAQNTTVPMSLSSHCCGEEASWLKSVQANSRSVNVTIVNKSLHRSCLTDPNLNRNQSCWIVLTSSTKLSLRFRPAARSFGAFSSSSLARSSFVQSCSVDLSALSQNWQIAIAHCLWRWVNRSLTCSFRIWMISHLIWKEEKKKPAC